MTTAITETEIIDSLRAHDLHIERVVLLLGDVSARVYARVFHADGSSSIYSFCPEHLRSTCRRFVETTRLLESIDIRVPKILAADIDAGWLLLEDLGEQTVYECHESWTQLLPYYADAAQIIQSIRRLDLKLVEALLPPLDAVVLRRELEQTWKVFLSPYKLYGSEEAPLRNALDSLCERIGGGPLEPCHRDFMVRNLMPIGHDRVALIDHQDLRLGPPLYDLASLLNDSLFAPPETEEQILAQSIQEPSERIDYRRAALQRTLKALGTFVAFFKQGNDRHIPLVEPTLRRAASLLESVPETESVATELAPIWKEWSVNDLVE